MRTNIQKTKNISKNSTTTTNMLTKLTHSRAVYMTSFFVKVTQVTQVAPKSSQVTRTSYNHFIVIICTLSSIDC